MGPVLSQGHQANNINNWWCPADARRSFISNHDWTQTHDPSIYIRSDCATETMWIRHLHLTILDPGPRFNIKMTSYRYRKSHCGDKTIERSSYLHNGISYTGKITSLYWMRAHDPKFPENISASKGLTIKDSIVYAMDLTLACNVKCVDNHRSEEYSWNTRQCAANASNGILDMHGLTQPCVKIREKLHTFWNVSNLTCVIRTMVDTMLDSRGALRRSHPSRALLRYFVMGNPVDLICGYINTHTQRNGDSQVWNGISHVHRFGR